MDFNQNVQFKRVYQHSHINIYNNPVIGATMPSIAFSPGLNLVSTNPSNNHINSQYEGNHIGALATLQVTPTSSTISIPTTAQLVPVGNFDTIQLQQMQHNTYIDQAKTGNQFLQVQIANPVTTMAQDCPVTAFNNQTVTSNSEAQASASSNKKTIVSVDGVKADLKSKPGESSTISSAATPKGTLDIDRNTKYNIPDDNHAQELGNKYAIINGGKGFRCLVCNREFTQKGNLKTHALTHLGVTERPYDCEICGRRFTQKGNRDIHVKIHTGTKDHTCPYCDRGFTQRGNLKTHIRSVHTGEKPFSCGHCGKAFSQKANMLTHFRTHDKNSRFACNICGKTFSQKGNLKTHQQRHVPGLDKLRESRSIT